MGLFSGMAAGFASAFGAATKSTMAEQLSRPMFSGVTKVWADTEMGLMGKIGRTVWSPATAIGEGLGYASRGATMARNMGPGIHGSYATAAGIGIGFGAGRITQGVGGAWLGMGAINIFRPGDNIGLF